MPHIQARSRQQLAAFLPSAITKALATYRTLTSLHIEDDASAYKKNQDACKVAVGHIHLLIKLARDVSTMESETDIKESDDHTLQTMIENAQKELRSHAE